MTAMTTMKQKDDDGDNCNDKVKATMENDDHDNDCGHPALSPDGESCTWRGVVAVTCTTTNNHHNKHKQPYKRQRQRQQPYKVTRRYYGSRFEQSIDIYEPIAFDEDDDHDHDHYDDDNSNNTTTAAAISSNTQRQHRRHRRRRRHIVVLVMGSGWTGHRSFIYAGTNWWNSAAPKSIVSCGHVAICVRHSGGFPRVGTTSRAVMAFMIIMYLLYDQVLKQYLQLLALDNSSNNNEVGSADQAVATTMTNMIIIVIMSTISTIINNIEWSDVIWKSSTSWTFWTIFVLVTYIFLHVQSSYGQHRPASIQDMINDVSKALSFIDRNATSAGWNLQQYHDTSNDREDNKIPIIFGGYSSGGHVAATLLLSPAQSPLPKRGHPVFSGDGGGGDEDDDGGDRVSNDITTTFVPSKLKNIKISKVLFLSGVLDVSADDDIMTLVSLTALNEWPEKIPSPLQMLKNRLTTLQQIQAQQQQQAQQTHSSRIDSLGPRQRQRRPSSYLYYPILPPHTLIGCKHEVMGVPVLKQSFCSSEYAKTLRNICHNNDHQCFLLQGRFWFSVNHWTILASPQLRHALLTKVFTDDDNKKGS